MNKSNNDTVPKLPFEVHSVLYQLSQTFFEWLAFLWDKFEPFIKFPLIIVFTLPILVFFFVYLSALLVYFWSKKHRIYLDLRRALEEHDVYQVAREVVTYFWDFHGWIFHGYEVEGLENVPLEGPAMLVYYHGVIPVDYYYLVAKLYIVQQRIIHSVVDKFLFKIWGMRTFLKVFKCEPGSQESCSAVLKEGHLLGLSPGGLYEALFGDENYQLMWKERVGFAKIALNTKCKVIPVFTVNIRETFRTPAFCRKLLKHLYNYTRLPIMPIYGGFPVKLKTIIGPPIEYDPENCTPEQLKQICQTALQKIIDDHQKKPGSIWRAFWQRFYCSNQSSSQHQR